MAKPDLERERGQGRKYAAAWKRMLERGVKPVVISRSANPEAWSKWRNFYRLNALAFHLEIMNSLNGKTVPCLDPFDMEPLETVQTDRRAG